MGSPLVTQHIKSWSSVFDQGLPGLMFGRSPPHHPLAHFLDQKALALLVGELELFDGHSLRCRAVASIDASEASEAFPDD